jgi:hypothetical protein
MFNWRPFVETFNARAVKPLVSFVVAYILVLNYQLDLVTQLVNDVNATKTPLNGMPGQVLTALVLAGGSAGVNNLLVALGFRQVRTPETTVPKPPPDKAWISVRVNLKKETVGPVQVFIGNRPDKTTPLPLVGIIHGTSKPGVRFFLTDPGRFPGYGGHQVPANTPVEVELLAKNSSSRISWGPQPIAGGAIIDLEIEV